MLKTLVVGAPALETDVLKYAVDEFISKAEELLAAGSGSDNVAELGSVLGKISVGALSAVYTARAGNTGTFTNVFANPAVAPGSKPGKYAIVFTGATTFRVEDPDGVEIGEGKTGVAFTQQLKFTITAGGTAAVAGDAADVVVTAAAGAGVVTPINFTATDGSQNAYCVALKKTIAPDGGAAQPILVLRRLACIDPTKLVWPAGATDDQKAAALAQLEANFIIQRPS